MSLEQEAKRLLMERLDDCLKVHADLLDSQDIGSIYELQDLAQLHYYLKVEHPFTPAEVEALLSFQDPLEVARWCKEENTHAHSFPICELLEKIGAYHKFDQVSSGPGRSKSRTDKTPGPELLLPTWKSWILSVRARWSQTRGKLRLSRKFIPIWPNTIPFSREKPNCCSGWMTLWAIYPADGPKMSTIPFLWKIKLRKILGTITGGGTFAAPGERFRERPAAKGY